MIRKEKRKKVGNTDREGKKIVSREGKKWNRKRTERKKQKKMEMESERKEKEWKMEKEKFK
jgi:hypothetical protein